MDTPHLIALSYSAWSEKARFALDHHGVAYVSHEHVPMMGEPFLRFITRRPFGRVSVPVLVHRGRVITDSFEIARYADRIGGGETLFPAERLPEIRAWDDESQRAMAAGRALVTSRVLASDGALEEALPPFVPSALRPFARPVAALGARFILAKYDALDVPTARATLENALQHLRESLGESRNLLGSFTFADVTMATLLQFVSPVDDRFIALGPATREAWTDAALAAQFADLVTWRDALYDEHRRSPVAPR